MSAIENESTMENDEGVPIAVTISGSDTSAGAGIQADLKTFSALGVYGATVLTALTAQNTMGVQSVFPVPPDFIACQWHSVIDDLDVRAIKIGMIGTAQAIVTVVDQLANCEGIPIVVDPVMVATSGDVLLEPAAEVELVEKLIPRADVLTPNLHEAARLLDSEVAASLDEMEVQSERLLKKGAKSVLVKGGHHIGSEAIDIFNTGTNIIRLSAPRIPTSNTHGTGCTLSSAIAAYLAMGRDLVTSVELAKIYLTKALKEADRLKVGRGHGPVNHFANRGC